MQIHFLIFKYVDKESLCCVLLDMELSQTALELQQAPAALP